MSDSAVGRSGSDNCLSLAQQEIHQCVQRRPYIGDCVLHCIQVVLQGDGHLSEFTPMLRLQSEKQRQCMLIQGSAARRNLGQAMHQHVSIAAGVESQLFQPPRELWL